MAHGTRPRPLIRPVPRKQAHRGDYEPFVEDDEPFESYCRRMRKDGTWAGNMEVQALSMLKQVNICIHQTAQPLWLIPNFPDRTVRNCQPARIFAAAVSP